MRLARSSHLWLLTACLILGFTLAKADNENALPELGDQTAALSPQSEFRMGRAYERSFRGSVPTLSDPLVQDYIEHLIYRLAFNTPITDLDLSILLIDSTDINAFAVPGGFVGLNAGVFMYAETEGELASVLAHELGHLKQRHYARMMAASKHDMWWYLAAMAAAIALSARGNGDAGMGAIATTQAAMAQNQLHYSRQYEQEADRIGLQTLVNAHIDPNAMPRFFQRLLEATAGGINIPAYLQDHPLTASRIADTASRAAQYPVHFPDDSTEFQVMRLRTQAFYNRDPKATLKKILPALGQLPTHIACSECNPASANPLGPTAHPEQELNATNPLTLTRVYAICLYQKLDQPASAEPLARQLLQQDPHRIAWVYLLGETLLQEKKNKEAVQLLDHELALSTDNLALELLDADALIADHQYQKAITQLQFLQEHRPDDPDVWNRLADAWSGSGDAVDLFRAKAELYYLQGDDTHALQQMHFGLQAAGNNYPERARFENRLNAMIQGHQDLKNQ